MNQSKITAVFPALPQPFGDTAARWFYVLVKGLLQGGNRVSCLTVSEESEKIARQAYDRLSSISPGQLEFKWLPMRSKAGVLRRKLASGLRPFSEILQADGAQDSLKSIMRGGYDLLHLEQLWTGWVGLNLDLPRTLLNIHHLEIIDWEGRSLKTFHEKKAHWQMRRATDRIIRSTKNMRVFTPRLLDKARSLNPSAKYWVVPFALDLSLYPLLPPVNDPVIGLIGSMHWTPSRSAGERLITRIWPLVRKRMPKARLLIAGWSARKHLGKYMPMPDVTLEDSLNHPTDFFSKVAVMVYAPSRGSGMKIKVLESMAYGVPVVTTWEGVEGIEYENGTHCCVEEEDSAIADRVAALLADEAGRLKMRQAARALMEERYSSAPVMKRMLQVYEDVLKQR